MKETKCLTTACISYQLVRFFFRRLRFSSWFATPSAVLHSHGHTVFEWWWTQAWPGWCPGSETLYPSTPCWVNVAASQRSPSPNSTLMSAGASGPSHKTNISPCKVCWDHRWRWTALGICFPLQPSCFEITYIFLWKHYCVTISFNGNFHARVADEAVHHSAPLFFIFFNFTVHTNINISSW